MISSLFKRFNLKDKNKDQDDILCDEIQVLSGADVVYIAFRAAGSITFHADWFDLKSTVGLQISDRTVLGKTDNHAVYIANVIASLKVNGCDIISWLDLGPMNKQDIPTGIIILDKLLSEQELYQLKKKWIERYSRNIMVQ